MSQQKYEVQTRIGDDWENTWQVDDKPQTFDDRSLAYFAIDEFFKELAEENMNDYSRDDYRVVPCQE